MTRIVHIQYLEGSDMTLDEFSMLDRIHMFIPFLDDATIQLGSVEHPFKVVDLESLGVSMRAAGGVTRRDDGGFDCEDLSHAWESLPSSYTPMAFKVFHQSLGMV